MASPAPEPTTLAPSGVAATPSAPAESAKHLAQPPRFSFRPRAVIAADSTVTAPPPLFSFRQPVVTRPTGDGATPQPQRTQPAPGFGSPIPTSTDEVDDDDSSAADATREERTALAPPPPDASYRLQTSDDGTVSILRTRQRTMSNQSTPAAIPAFTSKSAEEVLGKRVVPSLTLRRPGTDQEHHRSAFGCIAALQHYCYTQHDCDGRVPPLWPQICRLTSPPVHLPAGWLRRAAERSAMLVDITVTNVDDDFAVAVQRHAATLHTIKLLSTGSAPIVGDKIPDQLAMCTQLTSLAICGPLPPSCLVRFGLSEEEDTAVVPRLKHLVLDDNGKWGFRSLKRVLRCCVELESIEVLQPDVGLQQAPRAFLQCLSESGGSKTLRVLKLPKASAGFGRPWTMPLATCTQLHTVDFNHADFTPSHFEVLAESLTPLTNLTHLHLRGVPKSAVADEAFLKFSSLLESASATLQTLDAADTLFLGSAPVAAAMGRLGALQHLNISNAVQSQGQSRAVLEALAHCSSLHTLQARGNNFSGCGEAIAVLLRRLPRLAVLSLSRCSLTDADMVHVCGALLSAPALDTVDLSYNDCRDGGMSALAAAVRGADSARRSMRRVDLQHNDHISNGGFRDVLAALSERALIDALRLPGCGVTRAEVTALQPALPTTLLINADS